MEIRLHVRLATDIRVYLVQQVIELVLLLLLVVEEVLEALRGVGAPREAEPVLEEIQLLFAEVNRPRISKQGAMVRTYQVNGVYRTSCPTMLVSGSYLCTPPPPPELEPDYRIAIKEVSRGLSTLSSLIPTFFIRSTGFCICTSSASLHSAWNIFLVLVSL